MIDKAPGEIGFQWDRFNCWMRWVSIPAPKLFRTGECLGERFSPPANIIATRFWKDDRKRQKNNRGFYLCEIKGRKSKKTA